MKLSEFLKDKKQSSFNVKETTFEFSESTGEKIALLHLETPLEMVQGSQSITDSDTAESLRLEAYDVSIVRVYQRFFDDEGINLDEEGKGVVKSDLKLDVSSKGDVWLTDQSFAQFGREKRQEYKKERSSGIISRMQERRTLATFKDKVKEASSEKKSKATPTTVSE